jgi:hypothetical protein
MRSRLQAAFAIAAVILAGCESNEQKVERLRQDLAIACFDASHPSHPDSAAVARARCDVATRNLNAFLGGR